MFLKNQTIVPAPFLDRIFALLADTILQLILVWVVTLIMAFLPSQFLENYANWINLFYLMFILVVGIVYNVLFLWVMGNTTPGKKLLNLYLVDYQDKSELGWGQIFFRETIKRLYYSVLSMVAILLDVILITQNPDKRSFIDILAGTQVVKLVRN